MVYLGSGIKGILDGELFGIATRTWFIISIITAFAHQTYVWFCWRMQLHLGFITKLMPKTGFYVYAAGFFLLFFARMAVVLLLAISNRGSLGFNSLILYILAAIVTVPAVYAFYSVYKYFGLLRATGQDHFDETYRSLPFEKRGMFKYSKNAMYTYALLILLVPGLLFNSSAGLLLAIFNYTYVWIHYYTLELPDIRRMYG
ncbi:hypothetical protein KAU32_09780 [bacterium]|nr:hypothetical protein [bacterium]